MRNRKINQHRFLCQSADQICIKPCANLLCNTVSLPGSRCHLLLKLSRNKCQKPHLEIRTNNAELKKKSLLRFLNLAIRYVPGESYPSACLETYANLFSHCLGMRALFLLYDLLFFLSYALLLLLTISCRAYIVSHV